MAQYLANLRQRRTGAQHLGGRGVTEAVGAHCRQAGPLSGMADNRLHRIAPQPELWSASAHEQLGAAFVETAAAEVIDYGFPNIYRQRQPLMATPFPSDDDLGTP